MSEMVEKVARALADHVHSGGDFGMTGDDAFEDRRDDYLAMARAAIEAMREPTQEMALAIAYEIHMTDGEFGFQCEDADYLEYALKAHTAMIEFALEEGEIYEYLKARWAGTSPKFDIDKYFAERETLKKAMLLWDFLKAPKDDRGACGCVGKKYGEPVCKCAMECVILIDGGYFEVRSLGTRQALIEEEERKMEGYPEGYKAVRRSGTSCVTPANEAG